MTITKNLAKNCIKKIKMSSELNEDIYAKDELSNYNIYDYIIVNDDLERAAEELTAVLRSLRFLTNTLKKEIF